MRKLRIFFSKTGRARYISHLDLMRCFSRAFMRAQIAIAFTEGFNPRPKLSFVMPLSVFTEGLCEILDIVSEEELSEKELSERLSPELPCGIEILRVSEPVLKAGAAAYSRYLIEITHGKEKEEERLAFEEELLRLVSTSELRAEKSAKKGRERVLKELCIGEHIAEFRLLKSEECGFFEDREQGDAEGEVSGACEGKEGSEGSGRENRGRENREQENCGKSYFVTLLPSGPSLSINPRLLLSTLSKELGTEFRAVRIIRQNILDENFNELR